MRHSGDTIDGSERAAVARHLLAAADVVLSVGAVKYWSWDRTRALLLALVLGVAMSVTLVQGGLMAAKMGVAAEGFGPSGCDGCGGDHDTDADISTCLSVCGSAAHGLLPGEPVALFSTVRAGFWISRLVVAGRTTRPDHGPPKLLTPG
jgi:hypothetical protein